MEKTYQGFRTPMCPKTHVHQNLYKNQKIIMCESQNSRLNNQVGLGPMALLRILKGCTS